MSVLKVFIASLLLCLASFIAAEFLKEATSFSPYQSSTKFANKDKAYQFEVFEDGEMIRFEFRGQVPLNRWKSFEIEVYTVEGDYLFSYQDELWSESGRDTDGPWTERKTYAHFDMRFPKKGSYQVFLTDSSKSNRSTAKNHYTFRASHIRGDASNMKPIMIFFGIVAAGCFFILANRAEEKRNNMSWDTKSRYAIKSAKGNDSTGTFNVLCLGVFLLWFSVFFFAYANDDDDIDYIAFAYIHNEIEVDRSIRQQSLSGPNYRAGASRGGK